MLLSTKVRIMGRDCYKKLPVRWKRQTYGTLSAVCKISSLPSVSLKTPALLKSNCLKINNQLVRRKCYTEDNYESPLFTPLYKSTEDKSVTEYLSQLVDAFEKNDVKPDEVFDYCFQLQNLVYQQLYKSFPLLYRNTSSTLKQMNLYGKTGDFLNPIVENKDFEKCRMFILKQKSALPRKDLAGIILSFVYLGISLHSDIVNSLVDSLLESNYQHNLNSLAPISKLLLTFPSYHKPLINLIFTQFDRILLEEEDGVESNIMNISGILMNCDIYVNDDLTTRGVTHLLHLVKSKESLLYKELSTCLSLMSRLYQRSERSNQHQIKMIGQNETHIEQPGFLKHLQELQAYVFKIFPKYVDQLKCRDFSILNSSFRYLGLNDQTLQAMSDRRQILFQSELLIPEIADLLASISKPGGAFVTDHMIKTMVKTIDYVDINLLASFSHKIFKFNLFDAQLMEKFEKNVLDNFDILSDYSIRPFFYKIMFTLIIQKNQNTHFVEQFSSKLLDVLLPGQHGLTPFSLCLVYLYFLGNAKQELPNKITQRLLTVLPRCSLNNLAMCLKLIKRMHGPQIFQNRDIVISEIESAIRRKKGKIVSISTLSLLKDVFKNCPKEMELQQVMTNLTHFTKNMTNQDFVVLSQVFATLNYYQPQVSQDLENYLLENFDELDFRTVSNVTKGFSQNGYKPYHTEEFSRKCSGVLKEKLRNEENFLASLCFLYELCCLQIFPSDILRFVYGLDFMKHLDGYLQGRISDNPKKWRFLKKLLIHIDRCIAIECPELNIPWFNNTQYKTLYTEERSNKCLQRIQPVMYYVLMKVLGGPQYVSSSVKSSHGHYIPFQCELDRNGTPVNYNQILESNHQRIAILILTKWNYCLSSNCLNGEAMMKKRHLEILGYKTVEVPYYEWSSMALTDVESKVSYMNDKIFHS